MRTPWSHALPSTLARKRLGLGSWSTRSVGVAGNSRSLGSTLGGAVGSRAGGVAGSGADGVSLVTRPSCTRPCRSTASGSHTGTAAPDDRAGVNTVAASAGRNASARLGHGSRVNTTRRTAPSASM